MLLFWTCFGDLATVIYDSVESSLRARAKQSRLYCQLRRTMVLLSQALNVKTWIASLALAMTGLDFMMRLSRTVMPLLKLGICF